MTRLKIYLLVAISFFQFSAFGQNNGLLDNSVLDRFNHEDYESFLVYLAKNAIFPTEAFNTTGVLLSGLVLDYKGDLSQVFSLNSLAPSIDNSVLTLFESSQGYWEALNDSATKKSEIIIVPIVFSLDGTEYKIDTSNFKLDIQEEIVVTAIIRDQQAKANNYSKSDVLLRRYDQLFSKGTYIDAKEIVIELLRREPLNFDYYAKMIKLCVTQGNHEEANNYLRFIESYCKNQSIIDMTYY